MSFEGSHTTKRTFTVTFTPSASKYNLPLHALSLRKHDISFYQLYWNTERPRGLAYHSGSKSFVVSSLGPNVHFHSNEQISSYQPHWNIEMPYALSHHSGSNASAASSLWPHVHVYRIEHTPSLAHSSILSHGRDRRTSDIYFCMRWYGIQPCWAVNCESLQGRRPRV